MWHIFLWTAGFLLGALTHGSSMATQRVHDRGSGSLPHSPLHYSDYTWEVNTQIGLSCLSNVRFPGGFEITYLFRHTLHLPTHVQGRDLQMFCPQLLFKIGVLSAACPTINLERSYGSILTILIAL